MQVELIIKELDIKTSRSGGAGGQHVNKTETRVEVFFDIYNSSGLSFVEKKRLYVKLESKLIKGTVIRIVAQDTRSQLMNKTLAIDKLMELLVDGLKVQKKRRPTRISKSKIQKRLTNKKNRSDTKENRKKVKGSDD